MATLAEHETETEYDRVFEWRFAVLRRSGYPNSEAWLLASASEVDLRLAARLLADGCEPATAARILI
jgi:hypothetical protein